MEKGPSIQEQAAFYDRWNVAYRSGDIDRVPHEISIRGRRVVELLRATADSRLQVLEVGCGTGWLCGALSELGTVTAIDLSPRAIEIARRRQLSARFITADFCTYDFGDSRFDAVVCVETLFYVYDQPGFVARMARLLRPGGMLGLTAINKFVYERSADIRPPEQGQIRHWLSKREISQLLAPCFDIVSASTIEPRGDQGILRVVNSPKLNYLPNRLLGAHRVRRLKETCGFGGGVVILAQRNRRAP